MATTRLHGIDEERMSRRGFVLGQIRALRPLEFVTFIAPSSAGFAYVEVSRDEHHNICTVEIGAAPGLTRSTRAELEALGFGAIDQGAKLHWKGRGAERVASLVLHGWTDAAIYEQLRELVPSPDGQHSPLADAPDLLHEVRHLVVTS